MRATVTTDWQTRGAVSGPGGAPSSRPERLWIPVTVMALLFWTAYDGGSYDLAARATLGIVVWWVILALAAAGLIHRRRLTRALRVTRLVLLALVGWSALSLAWSSNLEASFDAVARILVYTGVFLTVVFLYRDERRLEWLDGLAAGAAGVALLSLVSRLFPAVFDAGSAFRFLPAGRARLNYPVGYWNGLAFFLAMGVPLVLRAAVASPRRSVRLVAAALLPVFACDLYLTSSRGGAAAAAIALVVFVIAARRRLATVAVGALAGGGAAVAIAALVHHGGVVSGTETRASVGLALTVLAACVGTAALVGLLEYVARRLPAPPVGAERAVPVAIVVGVALLVALSHPVQRFEAFKEPPQVRAAGPDYVQAHLLSTSGNGRWQLWQSAAREFAHHPGLGTGAGTFREWWERDRSIPVFVLDPHSFYLEAAGELGIVGLLLAIALLVVPVGYGALRCLRPADSVSKDGSADAALLAAVVAFAMGLGLDWMWQLTTVSVFGLVLIGLLVGGGPVRIYRDRRRPPLAPRIALVASAIASLVVLAVALTTAKMLGDSQAAAARGDVTTALRWAADAHTISPWAASPLLQRALVLEQAGRLRASTSALRAALDRDANDWAKWLILARVETKRGRIAEARKSLAEARRLNPLGMRGLGL